ncbi:type I restriction endonuclease subunit R [Hymenobacter jeollabukensis]|uniref:Type I restriction enzyme endonuclease subunit n=1 Tax=Hymenobacter jeollabukensis TaxID=2025313 RepID=A0A5R8WHK6_9BACT|nr:HsdR family type I site-specific deoxyribonuclease [Hymenobacter jeollabukensis]TLM87855.1 type I restriction endonuclease subunit R [Hymenobacter jeollabukensis]
MPTASLFRETPASKVPALLLLQALGYTYLPPAQVRTLRGQRSDEVLLTPVLNEALAQLNQRPPALGMAPQPLAEAGVRTSVEALRRYPLERGYVAANRHLHELLTLGRYHETTTANGERRSHAVRYIDWETPANNAFHVTEELAVARSGRADTFRPDIVLYVNGIPLVVIECKAPDQNSPEHQGIRQHMRSQAPDGIRGLYVYAQLLMAMCGPGPARYATTATPTELWARWRERPQDTPDHAARRARLQTLKNEASVNETLYAALRQHPEHAALHPPTVPAGGAPLSWELTEQDELLFHLCEPARLLELVRDYLLFEAGHKVVARYQQYYGVRRTLAGLADDPTRPGGVLWHSQGSGKSLTMVMLARQLTRHPAFPNPKIVLVTDRVELDEQLFHTFKRAGLSVEHASTGQRLVKLLGEAHSSTIISTLIHKFAAVVKTLQPVERDNLFVLVDEGHRTQYGRLSVQMRQVFPRARFVAFTGTPLQRGEKHTAEQFGGFLHKYPITDAVRDGAVLPLVYESRLPDFQVNADPLDRYFNHIAEPLTPYAQADLKRKFSRSGALNQAQQVLRAKAWDIAKHFSRFWKGNEGGFKGQVVAPSKRAAVQLKRLLDETRLVTSEVLISPPDEREGYDDAHAAGPTDEVLTFWARMMDRFGRPDQYEKNLKSQWLNPDGGPDLMIVVDKLLTGFDNPRNVVLYLCRRLTGHTLFQAIARVNRCAPGKSRGFILDYDGVTTELSAALEEFATDDFATYDPQALHDAAVPGLSLLDVNTELEELGAAHTDVHELFRGYVSNRHDPAAYILVLADEALRTRFFERLRRFGRLLQLGLSTLQWVRTVSPEQRALYEQDLVFFENLRRAIIQQYSLRVDYAQYEPQVQQLIDTHVTAGDIRVLTEPVDIFDREKFAAEVARLAQEGTTAQALTILTRTLRTVTDHFAEDPALNQRFSDLIKATLADYEAGRLADAELLRQARAHEAAVVGEPGSVRHDLPGALQDSHSVAAAVFRMVQPQLHNEAGTTGASLPAEAVAEWATEAESIMRRVLTDPATGAVRVDARQSRVSSQLRQAFEDHAWDLRRLLPSLTPIWLDDLILQLEQLAQARYRP